MTKNKAGSAKKGSPLWKVGVWATWWWALSCLWVLLLVWFAREYVEVSGWWSALSRSFQNTPWLQVLLLILLLGWVVGGVIWLSELKKAKISYKDGLKDLFLTLRK